MVVDLVSPRSTTIKSSELAPIPPNAFYGATGSGRENQNEKADESDIDDNMDVDNVDVDKMDTDMPALEPTISTQYVTNNLMRSYAYRS